MSFFSIYLISCIHVLRVYILLPFRNFILEILEDVHMVGNNARCFLLISDFLSHVSSSNYKFLHKIFTSWTFLFLSSFSLRSKIFTSFTSNIKSSFISIGTCGRNNDGSIYAFFNNKIWNTLCIFSKEGGNLNR